MGVGDLDLPTVALELVVDEARPGHRLDRRAHRLVVGDPCGEAAQAICVGRRDGRLNRLATLVEQVDIEALAT